MKSTLPLSPIYVTGYGAITSAGLTAEDTFQALSKGQTGIENITRWDISEWEFKLGGEIKHKDLRTLISDKKLLKLISRQDVIGLNAVQQAIQHSQLLEYRQDLNETEQTFFNDRTGVFVGSPGNRFEQQYDFLPVYQDAKGDMRVFAEKVFEHVNPMWLLRILPNNVLAYTGIQYGFKGVNENIVNHAVSGMQAIAEACRYLQMGLIDRAIVVAYESAIEPESQAYFGSLGLLSREGLFSFSNNRSGTILAEGAGCLILEREETAQARNATSYGEILADASVSEAAGIFSIRKDGDGVKRAIELALEKAQLRPSDIGFITTHGNGTQLSDQGEAFALTEVFGNYKTPVTALKWCVGHTLTAAGAIETILTLMAMQANLIPGLPYLNKVADDCASLNLSQNSRPLKNKTAAIINRGFSSMDTCLLVKAL